MGVLSINTSLINKEEIFSYLQSFMYGILKLTFKIASMFGPSTPTSAILWHFMTPAPVCYSTFNNKISDDRIEILCYVVTRGISELSIAGRNNQDYFRTLRSADLLHLIKH